MSKLEEDLGIVLFYRANKGISLTPSGEILYKYLRETKDLLLSCERVLVSMNDVEEGNIIIGVQSHIVRNYLMDKIDHFRTKHPRIKIGEVLKAKEGCNNSWYAIIIKYNEDDMYGVSRERFVKNAIWSNSEKLLDRTEVPNTTKQCIEVYNYNSNLK